AAINGKKLLGFSDKAKKALVGHAWPGNIRELQNTVERGVILAPNGGRVEVDHLFLSGAHIEDEDGFGLGPNGKIDTEQDSLARSLCSAVCDGALTLEQIETTLLETALDKARGNLSSAARMLGL